MSEIKIKDFILSDTQISDIKAANPNVSHRSNPRIIIALEDGCDFVLEKRAGRKKVRLVILVSQNQYYIESGNTKQILNVELLVDFLKPLGRKSIILTSTSWINTLYATKVFCGELFSFLNNKRMTALAKRGMVFFETKNDTARHSLLSFSSFGSASSTHTHFDTMNNPAVFNPIIPEHPIDIFADNYGGFGGFRPAAALSLFHEGWADWGNRAPETIHELLCLLNDCSAPLYSYMIDNMCKRYKATCKTVICDYLLNCKTHESLLFQSFYSFALIGRIFGIEKAKTAMEMFMDSPIDNLIPFEEIAALLIQKKIPYEDVTSIERADVIYHFSPNKFIDYLINEPAKQGYGDNMPLFLVQWSQSLYLQKRLYRKIPDKYPDALASGCMRLTYIAKKNKSKMKENMWKDAVDRMMPYEYTSGKFRIICPKDYSDLSEEGRQQSNCVGGYENTILSGRSMIFFLRSSDPKRRKKSLVTIEVNDDFTICQAKGRYNYSPSEEQAHFIREWAKEKNLNLNDAFPDDILDDFDEDYFDE